MSSEPNTHYSQKADHVIHRTRRRLMATVAKEYDRAVAADPALELPGPFTDRDQILHQLRGLKEKEHREITCARFARDPLYCIFPASQDSVEWYLDYYGVQHFIDCHNKSVAMYLCYPDRIESDRAAGGVLNSLDPWLYRHWFKPYESDIEHGRYIAKSITFRHHTRDTEPTLADILEFHQKLIQSFSSAIFRGATPEKLQRTSILPFPTTSGQPPEDLYMALNRTHTIRPLFKSLFMVIHQTKVSRRERFTVEEIDNLPVSLVYTGSAEGLSRPISFHSLHCNRQDFAEHNISDSSLCSVRTNLKSAIRFIMNLEEREEGHWRGKASPPLTDHAVDIGKEARELGWDDATHGKLPLNQPSSKWVNRRKYAEWTGPGALHHLHLVHVMMRFRRFSSNYVLEDDWWWWKVDSDLPETGVMGLIQRVMSVLTRLCSGKLS
ncbi:hypothetical protein FPANT_6798 [Fusarium pseudoanthophilum]|uniref:Uncharacterized protein n=1 Tax=Fusarium pseudoanthophilum TaxID=48495 RepID=A0A8H5P4I1_9HYPO|nr:hypothetical protein FPANT_6798 [Fusarium pseudoanthophilum]